MVYQGHLVLMAQAGHLWRRRHLGGHISSGCRGLVPRALLVRPQTRQLRVRALAHVALVGPFTRVQANVVPERGRLAEAAVAEAAHEGFVQSVDAHVRSQVAARVEATVADDAAHAPYGGAGGG